MDLLVLALLFAAVAAGFALGRRSASRSNTDTHGANVLAAKSAPAYMRGLTYLLQDEPDEAIDRFISDMAVNRETLEVHLGLGALLRRKGETERAIKVHQHLREHPHLDGAARDLAGLELARDYAASGLLDRAETLLLQVITQSQESSLRQHSLEALIGVYEDTGEWLKAIDVADRLTTQKFSPQADHWRRAQAHYACELAERALHKGEQQELSRWLKAALRYDPASARASLLQSEWDRREGKFPAAIATLTGVPRQAPELAGEIIGPLVDCYMQLDELAALCEALETHLQQFPSLEALAHLSRILRQLGGEAARTDALARHLPQLPEQRAALTLVATAKAEGIDLAVFEGVLQALLASWHEYHCRACGFTGRELHWRCPRCRHWGAVERIEWSGAGG